LQLCVRPLILALTAGRIVHRIGERPIFLASGAVVPSSVLLVTGLQRIGWPIVSCLPV
jgi:hypothetical protein